jgi:hypothetical protein
VRRARLVVDERELAEVLAHAKDAEDDLAPVSPISTTFTRPSRTRKRSSGSSSKTMTPLG